MEERESRCKECNAPLVFAIGPSGASLPLQRVRNVYRIEEGRAEPILDGVARYVSHFETCSKPQRFSRKRS